MLLSKVTYKKKVLILFHFFSYFQKNRFFPKPVVVVFLTKTCVNAKQTK